MPSLWEIYHDLQEPLREIVRSYFSKELVFGNTLRMQYDWDLIIPKKYLKAPIIHLDSGDTFSAMDIEHVPTLARMGSFDSLGLCYSFEKSPDPYGRMQEMCKYERLRKVDIMCHIRILCGYDDPVRKIMEYNGMFPKLLAMCPYEVRMKFMRFENIYWINYELALFGRNFYIAPGTPDYEEMKLRHRGIRGICSFMGHNEIQYTPRMCRALHRPYGVEFMLREYPQYGCAKCARSLLVMAIHELDMSTAERWFEAAIQAAPIFGTADYFLGTIIVHVLWHGLSAVNLRIIRRIVEFCTDAECILIRNSLYSAYDKYPLSVFIDFLVAINERIKTPLCIWDDLLKKAELAYTRKVCDLEFE